MRTISTTNARKNISRIVEAVKATGRPVAIGRRNKPEVIVTPYPQKYNPKVSDIVNFAATSGTFDFLWDEPDLYSDKDIKKWYGKRNSQKG
ncbi:hypothetical protein A3C21_02120 [Candidatus Kaiserbacteria bacterium RIFCSPHIGHO2_02_FULL_59_21]|uniref:Antitoxin n=1 Tax=Candidatus Kaiserbacteria bacterium RIFCSPHIGHO2_02_FULL_59_21 TaxID=1798500 RepID=A0A1F6E070_9BACT|nr:MAG: hypothetical protein A2766_03775 [Candidatus Kaiserbacteria bacterium RIFCSPHIGHO2_01_FULL_58_22]OGG67036.1 MAG: hypothetical protein A3C21_02120 [Candidatus Kaiserbacteria bacterium RIFCSPHIGHO2_02_FULL_59_21]OGG80313.1 MAG: hypothetical protein A2952_02030 [Candidatus Kaiserbacteria bacterium RIFCSPLOWO2_01_FULL_59_34]OGG85781.1 MAG: hypothetical protein A3I47_00660 [Candidatus Kaiserbacteria bacterium RIFCSPLOWO2_02_FULL_59_19]